MRKQALPGFTRGALESWQPMVNHLARTLVADLLALSPADVVSTLAVPMPMGMIAHILGIGEEDQAPFRKWSNDTVRVADINISGSGLREIVPTLRGFRHMHAFFIDKLSKGELLGEDTVLGRLARHTDDGKLSFEEMFFIAVLLLLAGNETTTNMLSTLFLTLSPRTPINWNCCGGGRISSVPLSRSSCDSARRSKASIAQRGSTTRSAVRRFLRGSRVLLAWGAANRDPRQFDDPDVFRAERNPTGHVAFGSGVHLCLGAQLARMGAKPSFVKSSTTSIESRLSAPRPGPRTRTCAASPGWTSGSHGGSGLPEVCGPDEHRQHDCHQKQRRDIAPQMPHVVSWPANDCTAMITACTADDHTTNQMKLRFASGLRAAFNRKTPMVT